MFQPFVYIPAAPLEGIGFFNHLAITTVIVGDFQQPLRGIRAPVQNHVFHPLAAMQTVYLHGCGELAGVDNPHIHTGLDGVVEKYGVDGLAHRVVATKRERHIGRSTRRPARAAAWP